MSHVVGSGWSFGGGNGLNGVDWPAGSVGTMSGTNKIVGPWVSIEQAQAIAWTNRWTGTPTGAFGVEVSNEWDPNKNPNPTDNAAYSLSKPAGTDPAGAAGVSGIDLGPTGFKAARLVYTNAAGAGTLVSSHRTKGY